MTDPMKALLEELRRIWIQTWPPRTCLHPYPHEVVPVLQKFTWRDRPVGKIDADLTQTIRICGHCRERIA